MEGQSRKLAMFAIAGGDAPGTRRAGGRCRVPRNLSNRLRTELASAVRQKLKQNAVKDPAESSPQASRKVQGTV
jgi:hypothetical protein